MTPSVLSTPRLIVGEDRRKERREKFNAKNESKYAFLLDIRDADGHRPGDKDYDPRTLYIPRSFWDQATPLEKQYWEVKRNMYDTIIFFKKGKFYEVGRSFINILHFVYSQ
jgi:DNA mismatch repair protein MSH6